MAIPPAGLAPAGLFIPQTFATPTDPPAILADAVDPETGEYLSISRGMHPIDQQVLIALVVQRNSGAALTDDGQEFGKIRKLDDTAARLIDGEARRALARLVEQKDIRIRAVYPNASPDNDWAEVGVEYENLRARASRRRLAKVMP
jgi:hypothetical protein